MIGALVTVAVFPFATAMRMLGVLVNDSLEVAETLGLLPAPE